MKKHRWLLICAMVVLLAFLLVEIVTFCYPLQTVWDLATMINSPDGASMWIQDEHFHSLHGEEEDRAVAILNNLRLSYSVGTRNFDWVSNRIVLEKEHQVQYFLFNDDFTVVWVVDWHHTDEPIAAYRVKNPWAIRKFFNETCKADREELFGEKTGEP